MPLFENVINSKFEATPIDYTYSVYDCYKDFYFARSHKSDDILIYKKQGEKFVLFTTLENAEYSSIDKNGTFFYAYKEESEVMSFEIQYPYDTVLKIEHLDLREYLNESKILNRHKEEFEATNIEQHSLEYGNFINQKRKEYVDSTFTGRLKCIRKVSIYGSFYFLDYINGKRQVLDGLEYINRNDALFIAATQISFEGSNEVFPYCDDMHKNFRDVDKNKQSCDLYNRDGKYSLELIDHITTDHYLQGSNHIAIGVGSNHLYYYSFKIGDETLQFKSTEHIMLGESVNYKNILITNSQAYALK